MSIRLLRSTLVLGAMLVVPTFLAAQRAPAATAGPAVRDLPAAAKSIEEPFSLVSSIREISQGRAVLADATEGEVYVVDFATGERAALGRQGSGPGEYRAPSAVFTLRGDTILVLDAPQQRFTVFLPNLENGVPIRAQFFDQATMTALMAPFHMDASGQLFASGLPIRGGGGQMSIPDSVHMVRFNPRVEGAWTLGDKLRFPTSGTPQMTMQPPVVKYSMQYPGLVAADSWAVFPDGRIAIVHGSNYTVEMIQPDGRRTTSRPIAYDRIPVTAADQTAEMDEARKGMADQMQAAKRNMPPNMTLEFELLPPETWPANYPAVAPMQVFAAPDGRLWVMRSTPARLQRQQWDVIDAAGNVVQRWRLPARARLIGVGTGVAFVVQLDEDDLQTLQRYDVGR